MKLSPGELESIIALLTRICEDIHVIEEEYRLLAGDHDFRPRIEHFHDAVRAFSSQEAVHQQPGGRLCIEFLASDLAALRQIQATPLAPLKLHGPIYSPSTAPVAVRSGDLTVRAKRPSRQVRERICELYQHYAVMFAALLKPLADRDYIDRTEELNQDVKDLHSLIAQLEQLLAGKNNVQGVVTAINHLEDEGLRHELMLFMQQEKYKKKDLLVKLIAFLKTHRGQKDQMIAGVDGAHMQYVMSQLAIFEESRDMLKKLAGQGMNLVGKFVQNAMQESKRDMGR